MYEVIYTGQFKRSLKLCVRRGLDVTLQPCLTSCKKKESCPKNIVHTNFKGNTKVVGNATYSPIGCWSGNRMTDNSIWYWWILEHIQICSDNMRYINKLKQKRIWYNCLLIDDVNYIFLPSLDIFPQFLLFIQTNIVHLQRVFNLLFNNCGDNT